MAAAPAGSLNVPLDIKQPDKKLKARGLTVYISDIRNCKTREQEEARVREEMANVRHKFAKAGKALSSYDRRKYVWKIVYTHMLGYQVDFGHMQTIELMASQVYSEKMCGYLALTLLIKNSDELMNLVVNTMKRDLQATSSAPVHCLVLTAAANLGGSMLASSIAEDVRRLVRDEQTPVTVQKKALLCLLRLARDSPAAVQMPTELELVVMADKDLSLTAAACACLKHILLERERNGPAEDETPEDALLWQRHRPQVQATAVRLLHRLTVTRQVDKKQIYNGTVNPFLQVALVEILVVLKTLPPAPEIRELLFASLHAILKGVQWTQSATVNNASRCASFDGMSPPESWVTPYGLTPHHPYGEQKQNNKAIALVSAYGKHSPGSLVDSALLLSQRYIESKNPNTRYLALSALCFVADSVVDRDPSDPWLARLRQLHPTIVASLKDKDASVRKRALNLLFHLCDAENAPIVVQEMLDHLRTSAFLDGKPEVVLRIAILAERFAKDSRWYVSTALRLIEIGGEYVADDVWYRVAQIVANDENIQRHAALLSYKALLSASHVYPATVRVATHILGEFGYLLVESPTSDVLDHDVLPIDLFGAIHRHFQFADASTRSLILAAYAKLLNLYEDLADPIEEVYDAVKHSADVDVQQRACEFALIAKLKPDTMHYLLEPMPPWPHDRQSPLIRRLAEVEQAATAAAPVTPRVTERRVVNIDEDNNNSTAAANWSHAHQHQGGGDDLENDDQAVEAAANLEEDDRGVQDTDAAPLLQSRVRQEQTRLYLNGLLSTKSLLYDDGGVQVGSQQTFALGRGTLQLFVGNTGSHELSEVFVELDADAAPESKLVITQQTQAPEVFAPGQQCLVEFSLECQGPFATSPIVYISCQPPSDVPKVIKLALPIVLSSFADPVSMRGEDFSKRWSGLEANNVQSVVLLQGAQAWGSAVTKALRCFDLLHFARVSEWPLDESATPSASAHTSDFAFASVLRTTTQHPATGALVTVGFLLRVELNAEARAARVSMRAAHPAVSSYVLPIITQQLQRIFA